MADLVTHEKCEKWRSEIWKALNARVPTAWFIGLLSAAILAIAGTYVFTWQQTSALAENLNNHEMVQAATDATTQAELKNMNATLSRIEGLLSEKLAARKAAQP